MSWPLWNQPVAQPEMMGLSGYTPEQWALMQQQNWQQWSQWQQQYSQWQTQYGDKYSEQMKNITPMGVQPPLPAVLPSQPPPPPPDGPPPPPQSSSGNDKKGALHGKSHHQPNTYSSQNSAQPSFDSHVPPPNFNQSNASQNYGYQSTTREMGPQNSKSYEINSNRFGVGALPEKVASKSSRDNYDSSQGEQWKNDSRQKENFVKSDSWNNNNRPGNENTGNYGKTDFSQKNNTSSNNRSQNNSSSSNFIETKKQTSDSADLTPTAVSQDHIITEEEKQFDNQFKKWEEDFFKWKEQNVNHPDKVAYREYEMKFEACREQLIQRKEEMRARRMALAKPEVTKPISEPAQDENFSYHDSNSQSNDNAFQEDYSANNYDDGNYDKDYYDDSGNNTADNIPEDGSNFLPNAQHGKGIPGLDLVEEDNSNVVNLDEDDAEVSQTPSVDISSKKPDLSAISQGINNILGDTKLLHMLSMVRQSNMNTDYSNQQINEMSDSNKDDGRGSRWSTQPSNPNMPSSVVENSNSPSNHGQPKHSPYSSNLQVNNNQMPGMVPMVQPNMPVANPAQGMWNMGTPQAMSNILTGMAGMPPAMGGMPSGMGSMPPAMGSMPPGMGNMRQGLGNMQQGMGNMQQGMGNMQQGMGSTQQGMGNIHQGMVNMQQGRVNMQQGMGNTQQGMGNTQQGMGNMQQGMGIMQQDMSNMQHGMGSAAHGMGIMQRRMDNMPPGNIPPLMRSMPQAMRNTPQEMEFQRRDPMMSDAPQLHNPNPMLLGTPNRNVNDKNMMRNSFQNNTMNMETPYMKADQANYMGQRFTNTPQQIPPIQPVESVEKPKPKWLDVPLLEPVTILDYQHKTIERGIDFLEPVQTFDYNHISTKKSGKTDFIDLTWEEMDSYSKKSGVKVIDYQNKPVEELRRENWGDRNTDYHSSTGSRYDDRYKDDRNSDRYRRNDKHDRDRDMIRRDERSRNWNEDRNWSDRSRERRGRYDRSHSRERKTGRRYSETRDAEPNSRRSEERDHQQGDKQTVENVTKNVVMIDDLLETPGREVRPAKIAIILRGLPGSGKSYLAKLIKDRELENGGSALRILSVDDYFMSEIETDVSNSDTGRKEKVRELKYEYESSMEEVYIASLIKSFKRTLADGFFSFIIVDGINNQHHHFKDMLVQAKQHGFMTYICEMDMDVQTCFKRNVHGRKLQDIQSLASNWFPTPPSQTILDPITLLQSAAIDHVQMEDVSCDEDTVEMEQAERNDEDEMSQVQAPFSSKWDRMDDTDKLARLDGTSKPLRHAAGTMEDFLQLDEWTAKKNVEPGKKTVRWADIEERREQEKMRAIGFVVGQTDWQRMTDPTKGSAALTQTKYIERVKKF